MVRLIIDRILLLGIAVLEEITELKGVCSYTTVGNFRQLRGNFIGQFWHVVCPSGVKIKLRVTCPSNNNIAKGEVISVRLPNEFTESNDANDLI